MKKLVLLLSLAGLGACSSDSAPAESANAADVFTTNDFESGGGWNTDPSYFDKGRAHSGQYAIKVDKDHEFSLTYDVALGKISSHKFKGIHLDAWVFMPSEKGTAHLGIQIMTPDNQQVFGSGLILRDAVKTYGKWVHVTKDFTLPDNITSNQHLRFFVWRADATDEVLVDDVKLSTID